MATGSGTGTPIAVTATNAPDHTAPLLPLDEWRRLLGFNPWHFWGLSNAGLAPSSNCNTIVRQYGWQGASVGTSNAAGRADIIEAIRTAEEKLRLYLGFSVAPRFELDTVAWPQSDNRYRHRLQSFGASGHWPAVRVRNGYVKALGVPRRTLIGNATVTLSDPDGDGLNERFTLTIGTTVTDPDELAVYFIAADRLNGEDVSERWRIQPVEVRIASGTATIVGRAWTIVKPVLYEGVDADDVDPTVSANFAGTLAVYRYYADSTDQGAFLWESAPGGCCENIDPSGIATASARYTIRDADLGYVAGETATYNTTTALWQSSAWGVYYEPSHVRVGYQAGAPLENGQMAWRFKEIVTRLAAAELARAICACETANMEMHRWQFDRARTGGANDESYAVGTEDLENQFGTLWGQIWAWKQVKRLALAGAGLP